MRMSHCIYASAAAWIACAAWGSDYEWSRESLTLTVAASAEVDLPGESDIPYEETEDGTILDRDEMDDEVDDTGAPDGPEVDGSATASGSSAHASGAAQLLGSMAGNPNSQNVFDLVCGVIGFASASTDTEFEGDVRAYAENGYNGLGRYRLTSPVYSDGHTARGVIEFRFTSDLYVQNGFSQAANTITITMQVKCGIDAEGTTPTLNDDPDFTVFSDGTWGFDISGWREADDGYGGTYYEWQTENVQLSGVDDVEYYGTTAFLLPGLKVGCVVDVRDSYWYGCQSEINLPDSTADTTNSTTLDVNVTASEP